MMIETYFTILLLGHALEDRAFCRCWLEQSENPSFKVLEATTVQEGVDLCQQMTPDAIVLDYRPSDLDAVNFLSQLHQLLLSQDKIWDVAPPSAAQHPKSYPLSFSGKGVNQDLGSSDIPVILLIERADLAAAVEAVNRNTVDYLVKDDLNAAVLCRKVSHMVQYSQLQRQLTQQQATIAHQLEVQKSLDENQGCLRLIGAIMVECMADFTVEQVIEHMVSQVYCFYPGLRVRYCVIDQDDRLQTQVSLQPSGLYNCAGMEFDMKQAPDYLAALRSHQPLVAPDIAQEPKLVPIGDRLLQINIQAMLAIPLRHSTTALGLLSLTCDQPRTWSPAEVQTFTEIANLLSFALQAVRDRGLLSAVFNESADALFLVNAETLLTLDCNDRAVQLFEADHKQSLIGIEGRTLQHQTFTDEELQKISDQINTQGVWSCEVEYITRRGRLFWGNLAVKQVTVAGQLLNLVRVTDISVRKQTELALKKTSEELDRFFSVALDLLCIASTDGYFLRLNPTWEKTLGYRLEHLENHKFLEFVHPDDLPSTLEAIAQLSDQHELLNFVNRYRHRDGSYRWIEWRSMPIGTIIYAAARDITERKQTELTLQQLNEELEVRVQQRTQELMRSQTALQENEERLRLALTAANQGLYDLNLQTGHAIVTPEYATMLGYDPAEFHETVEQWIERLHPDDIERVASTYLTYVQGDLLDYQVEFRQRTRHGDWKWILSLGKIVEWDANGRPMRMVGTYTDISDRKVAEAALQQVNSELEHRVEQRTAELKQAKEASEAANQAKSLFLANMSHELRTPLNAILGFSQLLAYHPTLPQPQQEQISIITRSGEHLLSLINDILEISKVEAGRSNFAPTNFDLHSLLATLQQMFASRAHSKGLRLRCELEPNLPQYVHTDEKKLRQILINLLGNAVKFTSKGWVALRVSQSVTGDSTAVAQDGSLSPLPLYLQFEIADTGMGIAEDELEAIFDPFVQSRQSNKHQTEGTGLGLAISRQFVHLLEGELRVSSTLGQGSTFRFTIPVVQLQASTITDQSLEKQAIAIAPDHPTYRILVVEDDWANCQLLLSLLQSFGFEVQMAANGQEALLLWQSWQPHLIWMDIRMPVMDGYQATRQIRAVERLRSASLQRTKIIALTAGAFEEDRAKAWAAGCDDFVCKPLQATAILKKMGEHLGVEYVYNEETHGKPMGNSINLPVSGLSSTLHVMPIEWLTQLYQATIQLNSKTILALTHDIPEEHAILAHLLREKVNDFDFEQIMHLTQGAMRQVIARSNDASHP